MTADKMYVTPEGFELARPLLLPDVRSFGEILDYIAEWDHATMSHRNGVLPANSPRPAPMMIGENEIGPFCSVRVGGGRRGLAVVARQNVLDVVAPRIVTEDDHLSFEIIEHKGRDRALVILGHSYIIGSHWLAYIDPATVPAAP